MTPETAREQIDRLKADPADSYHHPEHPNYGARRAEVEQWYRAAYPESAPTADDVLTPELAALKAKYDGRTTPNAPAASVSLPTLAPDLGVAWDEGKIGALHQEAERHGLPSEALAFGLRVAAEELQAGVPSPAHAEATLRTAWKTDYDHQLEVARVVFRRLPPDVRADLDRTGLGNSPRLIKYFAALGETLQRVPRSGRDERERPDNTATSDA